MTTADWATVASMVTAITTLVLAIATFASVRSGNRTARAAERALQISLRPLLGPSRLTDPPQKIGFADEHRLLLPGGCGGVDVTDNVIYMAMSLRNIGNGIGVLHGWQWLDRLPDREHRPDPGQFRRLQRDIYIPAGDIGFWQGAVRDSNDPLFGAIRDAVAARQRLGFELLYGDHEGGQRTVSLFSMTPREDDDGWLVSVGRHFNIDRPDPR